MGRKGSGVEDREARGREAERKKGREAKQSPPRRVLSIFWHFLALSLPLTLCHNLEKDRANCYLERTILTQYVCGSPTLTGLRKT